jgi:hypothetical protein
VCERAAAWERATEKRSEGSGVERDFVPGSLSGGSVCAHGRVRVRSAGSRKRDCFRWGELQKVGATDDVNLDDATQFGVIVIRQRTVTAQLLDGEGNMARSRSWLTFQVRGSYVHPYVLDRLESFGSASHMRNYPSNSYSL